MIVWPSIDLKAGQCVRLEQGDMARATVFNAVPAEQAVTFYTQGFRHLHIVDLDGAFAAKPVNLDAVCSCIAASDAEIQLGGGIRTMETIEMWLQAKVARVILGTIAVRDPDFVRTATRHFPQKIAVGIDARNGRVVHSGWAKESTIDVLSLAKKLEDSGVSAIIYTDIARDGMLGGVNIDATLSLARSISIPVIASGGVGTIADIEALLAHESDGICGVIAGRALYDGRLTAAQCAAFDGVEMAVPSPPQTP